MSRIVKFIDKKIDFQLSRVGNGGERWRGTGESFGGDENILILFMVMVVQLHENNKNYYIVHLKWVKYVWINVNKVVF